jgi:L-arabinose isomerase
MSIGNVKQKGKAGVMIVGHKEYWPQFPGEREDIIASGECFENLLERCGSEVIRYYANDRYSRKSV